MSADLRPVVLCIGGLDPAGEAGILADVRTIQLLGGRPLAVVTAHTFQTSRRAEGFVPVDSDVVVRQVRMLLEDEPVRAIKLGQLPSGALAEALAPLMDRPLVVDTPLATSSGSALIHASLICDAYAPLLAKATLVTPNREEVFALAGQAGGDAEAAARLLGIDVLLKGGHAEGPEAIDMLIRRDGSRDMFPAPRLPGRFRGTGCRLASAIAYHLAAGSSVTDAVACGKRWLHAQLAGSSR